MIIISWDVGVIHLAYCVLEYNATENKNVKILDWDEINLIEDKRLKLVCCGKMKAKKGQEPNVCGKNATYVLNLSNKEPIGFCKTHLNQYSEYWSQNDTEYLFKENHSDHKCGFSKKDGTKCGKKTKYSYKYLDTKLYYCNTHYKSELQKKIKQFSPQPIKNMIVKKYPTADLQLNLVKKLDGLAKHFSLLKIEEVIIENQPSMKNPKMKAIASTLFDYFMIRGYIDRIHNMDIKLVRFMCPSNKLRVNENNTIEVFRNNKDKTKKYKLTKELGIKYTRQLLKNHPEQLEYLDCYSKKDDICDAYLQGRYYLEFIKNKSTSNAKKTHKNRRKKIKRNGSKSYKTKPNKKNQKDKDVVSL